MRRRIWSFPTIPDPTTEEHCTACGGEFKYTGPKPVAAAYAWRTGHRCAPMTETRKKK